MSLDSPDSTDCQPWIAAQRKSKQSRSPDCVEIQASEVDVEPPPRKELTRDVHRPNMPTRPTTESEINEATQAGWDRGQQLKARLAALIRSGVVTVREIDAKQGGSLDVGIDDGSSNGCTMIALMLFALFHYGAFNLSNFSSVILFWCSPVLKAIRNYAGEFVEPEPAIEQLRSRGLLSTEVMTVHSTIVNF